MECPCGSQTGFDVCCEPFLKGEKFPETAEKLMRSRYTAFYKMDVPYIRDTLAPVARKEFDPKSLQTSVGKVKWKQLKIISTEKGGPEDSVGTVEFSALYDYEGKTIEHHEVSQFSKNEEGHWLFEDGESHTHKEGEGHGHGKPQTVVRESPKVGRNDPCTCGSGKKFKKCCGAG